MSEQGGAAASNQLLVWLRSDPWRFDLIVAFVISGFGTALVLAGPEEFDTGWPEVAAGVGAFVLMALRRRWPIPLLAVSLVAVAAHIAIYERPTPMIFATLVLLATVCVRLDRWPAIAVGASIGISMYLLAVVGTEAQAAESRALIGVVWAAFAVGAADAVRSWRRYRESVDAQMRAAAAAAAAEAREQVTEERLTIARELHDLLAHNLSVMNVQTGAALHLLRSDPDQAEASLTTARDAGRNVLDELTGLLSVLRDGESTRGSAPTGSLPTIDQLDGLVDTMRSSGLDVTVSQTGSTRSLSPGASLAAYRIVQEGLTNAAKHGDGTAQVGLDWSGDGLTIVIANPISSRRTTPDGPASGQHGLIGMRERAAANGGRLRYGPKQSFFQVDAWLPVRNDDAEEHS